MNAAAELTDLLGEQCIATAEGDRERHAHDLTAAALLARRAGRAPTRPACVVRPRTTEHVASVLKWADTTATPVVPFGGGSGVSRGIAVDGGVVVDLGEMHRLTLDEKSRLARAQAGVTGTQLSVELGTRGFTLGHEPQSLALSTVGGWVATRATGQLSARYGGIEKLVSGIEAVFPGGRVVRSKVAPRSSVGPDVASLMIGSEGALGIVTEVSLRVSELARSRVHRALAFEHMSDGVAACRIVAQADLRPTLVRLYDQDDATIFFRKLENPPTTPVLLMSFDGSGAEERVEDAVSRCGGSPASPRLVEWWWEYRNDAVTEYGRIMAGEGLLGRHGLVDTVEVSGTWTILRDLYDAMKEALTDEADLVGCHLSHVYVDGACLYFTLASICTDDDEAAARLDRWWDVAMRTCLDGGGSISHHHGIGRLKARWLPEEMGGWWEVLHDIKQVIDPKRIMNPGVLGL